jgi:hypothetical protein
MGHNATAHVVDDDGTRAREDEGEGPEGFRDVCMASPSAPSCGCLPSLDIRLDHCFEAGKEPTEAAAGHAVKARGPFLPGGDQSGILQDGKVFRDGGLIGSNRLGDFCDAHLVLPEQVKHHQAARMGERFGDSGSGFVTLLAIHGCMAI